MNWYRHLTILGVIALAALVFAGEQASQHSFAEDWGTIPARVHAAFDQLRNGQVSAESLQAFATLVTSIFLHGNIEHILFNMVFLWTFGFLASELLGQWRALAVFLVSGVGGSIGHTLLNLDSPAPMVGASGAVCGLEGLYIGLSLRWQLPYAEVWPLAHPVPPIQLVAFAVIGFIGDLLLLARHDQQIAYGAHLGGLLTGVLIAAIITTIYPTIEAYERAGR